MNTLEFIGTKKVTIVKVIDQLIEVSFAMFVNKVRLGSAKGYDWNFNTA